ncbi:MAG TPA: OmpA family protein, partial [Gammaproteobacteria bacterium]|nr:OmpA family protein [Gammaproteobacteria bacterium]
EVSAATPLGTVVNRAQAFGAGNAESNTATAQVQIQNELMQDVNTIVGRVVGGCDKEGEAPAKGVAHVRVLMENGAYAVTDKDGRYHFEAVKNGTHVVQLDKSSLPQGYEVESCEDNTRFAGRSYSQFVELHGGALWHADFHVRKLPPPEGHVSLQLRQQGDGARVHNRVELNADKVPVKHLSVTVLLPATLHYIPGTAKLGGKPLPDPQDMGGALIFRLDDRSAGWHGELAFDTDAAANSQAGKFWVTHALANFDTPSSKHQHTPVVEAKLPVVPHYVSRHEVFVIDHFGFGRYDLGPEQKQEVDKLVAAIKYARNVTLTITGYTDDVHVHADAAYRDNQELSVDRARAIVAYLRQAVGMNWSDVRIVGRADQDPVASNRTDAGRADNRRTVIDADFEAQGVPLLNDLAQSPIQKVATKGVAPADATTGGAASSAPAPEAESDADKTKDDGFKLDAHWLQTASPAPEIIWPVKNRLPASPAIHVAVKHAPDTRVHLSVNGQPVSARNYMGDTRNKARTVAVAEWLGVPLVEGDNRLVAEIVQGGKVIDRIEHNVHYSGAPVRAEIIPAKSVLIADGKTKPRIAIRFYDRWGYPVRRGMVGRYVVEAPYTSYQSEQDLQKRQLLAIGPREPVYTVGDDGVATIVLTPTNTSGQVTLDVPLANHTQQQLSAWLKPGKREWVLVGIANGTAAFNGISGHMQTLDGDDPNRDIYQDGRVAFYAKGMIKGEYLITAAYDSAKASGVTLNGLQQTVDPNQYFMLYGDASERGYDAQSASKLYLKIERGQFYAMFGDFTTGLTVTELARYDRQFNGVKSEYEGKHFKYNAFAARNAQSYVHDEIQGNGTSGLYHLSHQHILLNSERITIETRDRYHSERVISSQPLNRYLDYTIDYESGAIFFKQPVPSRDENFNPVYIVAEYEVTRPGDQAITGGGRVAAKFAHDKIEVGATYVNEGTGDGANKLSGADLRVDFSPTTELKAEVARTSTGANGVASTLAGNGLPPGTAVGTNNSDTSGAAYLATLQTHGKKLEGEVYLRQQGAGFGLGQQSLGQSGMRKLGADGRYRLDEKWSLQGELYKQQSLTQTGSQNVADAGFAYADSGNSLTAGVRHVEDSYLLPIPAGEPATSAGTTPAAASGETDQVYLGGSVGVFDNQLTLHGTTSQNVSGNDPAYPKSTALGADYKLSDAVTLFAKEQFAGGNGQPSTRMTEMGVRSTPWERAQITSSVTQQMTEYGPRTFSTMGLTQGWQATKALTLTAGLNRVSTMHSPAVPVTNAATPPPVGTNSEDFTSLFFGGTYRQKLWSWTGRAETLHSSSQRNYGLFSGFYRDLENGDAFSASLQIFDSSYQGGGTSSSVDGRLGFAHRPDNSAWTVLEQLDLIYGNQQGQTGSLFAQQGATGIAASQQSPAALAAAQGTAAGAGINQKTWKLVNNLQLNYRPDGRSQWSIYYGSKFARYHFDSGEYQGYTDLLGSEYRYDLTSRWDIGLVASRLHTWRSNVFKNSFGVETGTDIAKNMWLSIGYNFLGFYDQDFAAAHYTAKGIFIRFRLKFDQDTVREMADTMF